MADALASGASVRKDVGVQVPPRPPVPRCVPTTTTVWHLSFPVSNNSRLSGSIVLDTGLKICLPYARSHERSKS